MSPFSAISSELCCQAITLRQRLNGDRVILSCEDFLVTNVFLQNLAEFSGTAAPESEEGRRPNTVAPLLSTTSVVQPQSQVLKAQTCQ